MKQTTNYSMHLPEVSDYADIGVLNENTVKIDGELKKAETHRGEGASHVTAKEKKCWDGKADKLVPAAAGNLAALDAAGNLTDSGKKAVDFAAENHRHSKSEITDFPSTMSPTAHSASHKTGGTDALVPGDIGAYTKEETLSADTRMALGLSAEATPNEATNLLARFQSNLGNEYLWEKRKDVSQVILSDPLELNVVYSDSPSKTVELKYSSEFYADTAGRVWVKNPTTILISYDNCVSFETTLRGKYYSTGGGGAQRFTQDFTFNRHISSQIYTARAFVYRLSADYKAELEYANAQSLSAYPPVTPDGWEYSSLGRVGAKASIETINYVGTGLFGSGNPTVISFSFFPKVVFIFEPRMQQIGVIAQGVENMMVVAGGGRTTTLSYVTFANKTCSFHEDTAYKQFNESGYKYSAIAIG